MKKNFYITTTLPYVNAPLHLGHAVEIIRADTISRYQKLQGREVFLNTGTDEHGQKIFEAAKEAGKTPQAERLSPSRIRAARPSSTRRWSAPKRRPISPSRPRPARRGMPPKRPMSVRAPRRRPPGKRSALQNSRRVLRARKPRSSRQSRPRLPNRRRRHRPRRLSS